MCRKEGGFAVMEREGASQGGHKGAVLSCGNKGAVTPGMQGGRKEERIREGVEGRGEGPVRD